MEKMASLMQGLRTQPLREIAGLPVEGYTDYEAEGTGLPKANVLEYRLPGGSKVIIRPSGTEPKIRVMVEGQDLDAIHRCADRIVDKINKRILGQ